MALGVVVGPGAQYSGSLTTSQLAMEFGREAYGVPGPVTQSSSCGPKPLIEQGAKWITGWEDVVEGLPTSLLSIEEARRVDDLVENSGLTSSEVRAALFDRELGGVIPQLPLPGKQFLKVLL
jgi:predicted Rossmann fold nucleotide-binding protein DprA/Smf involved in DNA uptake